jgi:hypothetical protein
MDKLLTTKQPRLHCCLGRAATGTDHYHCSGFFRLERLALEKENKKGKDGKSTPLPLSGGPGVQGIN